MSVLICSADTKCSLCDPESSTPHEMKVLRLRVANMCCAGEEVTVRQVLGGFKGVEDVSVNVIGRYAVLRHCPQSCCAQAERIVQALNEKSLGVSIQEAFDDRADEQAGEAVSRLLVAHMILICGLFFAGVAFETFSAPSRRVHDIQSVVSLTYLACCLSGVAPVFVRAVDSLLRRAIDINILVLFAVFASICAQDFRDGALVVTVFDASQILQEIVLYHVRQSIQITASRLGRFALRLEGTEQRTCLLEDLHIGDCIALRAGDMIPIDGEVVAGQCVVDESAITGEAAPVHKTVGSSVTSGGIVHNGYVEVLVKVEAKDSVMRKLDEIVSDVQARKGKIASIVDYFAAFWIPIVVAGATVFIVLSGLISGDWQGSMTNGLVLMLLSCPCSIVLAAPIASLSTIAVAARHGVVIKGSEVLETLGLIDCIAVDKTGTLTKGTFNVLNRRRFRTEKEEEEEDSEDVYNPTRLAAALENKSAHPLANAIIREYTDCLTDMKETFPESRKVKVLEGVGIEGWVDVPGRDPVHVAVGNERLFKNHEKLSFVRSPVVSEVKNSGATPYKGKCVLRKGQEIELKQFVDTCPTSTIVFVSVDDEMALCLSLGDEMREEAHLAMKQFRDLNCTVTMLTGDDGAVAAKVCHELGIPECRSRLRPDEKFQHIHQLRQEGKCVMMLGDGINDTTALAAASVGVAMGAAGSAMAVTAADVVLMTDSLSRLPATLAAARVARALIMQNIVLSVGIKGAAMVFAMMGYLELWQAVAIDIVSLLLVLANGLRPLSKNFDLDAAQLMSATPGADPAPDAGEKQHLLVAERGSGGYNSV